MKKRSVAVIGLGVTGIAAVKNLREAGFDVQGFDENDDIGGLWRWSRDPERTTVLKNTRANIARQRNCYQDFPFPDDVPNYPSAEDIVKYLEAYVNHFGLREHFRLGLKVERLERSSDGTQWTITFIDKTSKRVTQHFDKVLSATGPYRAPFIPEVPGADEFQGKIMHAQAYKDPNDFAGKRVVVVGLSNTGGDTAVDLSGTASHVYLSHRSGARIISRSPETETPLENRITRRVLMLGMWMNQHLPWLSGKLSTVAVEHRMRSGNPKLQPEWNLLPAPPMVNALPIMNDYILQRFEDGTVIPKPGLKRFVAPSSIEFADQTTLEGVDAVIFATGYQADYSTLAPEADPTAFPTPDWDHAPHSNGLKYARLYQGMFSTAHPASLAFIGPFRGHSFAIFNNADLSTTAVAQVFAGNYDLPPQAEMEAWCAANYAFNLKKISKWRIAKAENNPREFERWLNSASGNGVNESLGWGWEGWKFWWNERRLYRMVVDGMDTPYLYRLFEGRKAEGARTTWDGARAAIEHANRKK